MTVDEKREIVTEYCGKHSCSKCVLRGTKISKYLNCLDIASCGETELDTAISYINGEVSKNSENDPVNRPSYYTDGKIEVIDFIEDKKLGFCLGNAIKYIARAGKKDTDKEAQDIKKAIWYLNRYLKELEEASV